MKALKINSVNIISSIAILLAIALSLFLYKITNRRNVERSASDYSISSQNLVKEFLNDYEASNQKYLADNGESSILTITGKVHSIAKDGDGKTVVLLKEKGEEAGVSCTFDSEPELSENPDKLAIKGEIHLGAQFDKDLKAYEDAILEHCTLE